MVNTQYVSQYIHRATHDDTLEIPDRARANGSLEVLEALYSAHQKGGKEAAKRVFDEIQRHKPEVSKLQTPVWNIFPASQLKNLPPLEWIVGGMLPKRAFCEIHGAPGVGKSLFCLHLACTVALNAPVLYIAFEGASGHHIRFEAWKQHHQKNPGDNLWFVIDEKFKLMNPDNIASFTQTVRELSPTLIIIDTLARAMPPGEENSQRDMSIIVDACQKLINELGVTVLLVHHTDKKGNYERGSSALRGAIDSMMEMTTKHDVITIRSVKLKDGKAFETLYMSHKQVGDSVVLVPIEPRDIKVHSDLEDNEEQTLRVLLKEPYRQSGIRSTELQRQAKLSNGTYSRVRKKLLEGGYLGQAISKGPLTITEKGIRTLQGPNGATSTEPPTN